ncbi:MAG: hypothetical protein NT120_00275 [Candidatus Aenigmarchaeota archaeon]|nr:hypothetical protein [Candidatus Aenigmarchaeota archaeon]
MIEKFIKREQLIRDNTIKSLAGSYIKKAISNLITMEILSKAESHKDILAIPKNHSTEEWIVVTAYYAMYVRVRKEEIEMLRDVRDRREIAQYSVTKKTTKEIAEKTKSDAREFVDRMEEIFEKM